MFGFVEGLRTALLFVTRSNSYLCETRGEWWVGGMGLVYRSVKVKEIMLCKKKIVETAGLEPALFEIRLEQPRLLQEAQPNLC